MTCWTLRHTPNQNCTEPFSLDQKNNVVEWDPWGQDDEAWLASTRQEQKTRTSQSNCFFSFSIPFLGGGKKDTRKMDLPTAAHRQIRKDWTHDGDGFLLACENYASSEKFDKLFPACAFFLWSRDQLTHANSTLFGQGSVHSGSASQDDCGQRLFWRCALVSLMGSHAAWTV